MAKLKKVFICQNCGSDFPKWLGKCPSCNQWNSLVEEVVQTSKAASSGSTLQNPSVWAKPLKLSEIESEKYVRLKTNISELDRVLGGGIVPGSIILLGGEPGIGKSTLALQLVASLKQKNILYISGEESAHQVKSRAERLKVSNEQFLLWNETLVEVIAEKAVGLNPDLMIIDSVQTLNSQQLDSPSGSVSQLRECTHRVQQMAKNNNIPVLLIGHITKEGSIAGPKLLEHMVDVVLQFEGDNQHEYRILRSLKNRFGSTSELGLFEMKQSGLAEILNPSEVLLRQNGEEELSGCAITCSVDGMRPFLLETEALVSSAAYGTPQRSSTGFDPKRLNMLLAVLERKAGFKLSFKDVFINIAGGIKVIDPAIDLAIVASVLSSNFDMPVNKKYCFAAEIGLTGEIRPVGKIEQRVNEAKKLGFQKFFLSQHNMAAISKAAKGIELVPLKKMEDMLRNIFQK